MEVLEENLATGFRMVLYGSRKIRLVIQNTTSINYLEKPLAGKIWWTRNGDPWGLAHADSARLVVDTSTHFSKMLWQIASRRYMQGCEMMSRPTTASL